MRDQDGNAGREKGEGDVTALLKCINQGELGATDALYRLVYEELRQMAHRRMQHVPLSDTLQPTALVHETYLRLLGRDGMQLAGRTHFFAIAARAMHDILVEQARRHAAQVRGGSFRRVDLEDQADRQRGASPAEILALNEALEALRRVDPLSAEVALIRTFGGLTHEEVGEALGIPLIKARRQWDYARSFLRDHLDSDRRKKGTVP